LTESRGGIDHLTCPVAATAFGRARAVSDDRPPPNLVLRRVEEAAPRLWPALDRSSDVDRFGNTRLVLGDLFYGA
jgi:hypothetical protein